VGLLVPVPVTLCLPQRCCFKLVLGSLLQVLPLLLPPRLLIDTTAAIAHCIPYLTLTLLLSTNNKHCEQCFSFQTTRENIMPCPPSETDEQKELSKAVPAPIDNPAHSTSDLLGTITSTPEEKDARRAANKERYDPIRSGMMCCCTPRTCLPNQAITYGLLHACMYRFAGTLGFYRNCPDLEKIVAEFELLGGRVSFQVVCAG
jgi:hypothetical protein